MRLVHGAVPTRPDTLNMHAVKLPAFCSKPVPPAAVSTCFRSEMQWVRRWLRADVGVELEYTDIFARRAPALPAALISPHV